MRSFLALAIALLLAFAAQFLLTQHQPPNPIASGVLFAASLGIALWVLRGGSEYGDTSIRPPEVAGGGRQKWRAYLLVASFACFALALLLEQRRGFPEIAAALWLLSLLAFAAAFWRREGKTNPLESTDARPDISRTLEMVSLVLILTLAFALRFVSLTDMPPSVHGDEGEMGLVAKDLLAGRVRDLFSLGWTGFSIFSYSLIAGPMGLIGQNLFGLRMSSVVVGMLSIPFFYLLCKSLFNVRLALLAAFLLAVSQPYIHYSRLGGNYLQADLILLMGLYLLLRGLRNGEGMSFVGSGLALGLSWQTYYAARILPLLMVALLLHLFLTRRELIMRNSRNLAVLVTMAVLTFAPMGLYFLDHPDPLIARSRDVFVFNARAHFKSAHGTDDTLEMLRIQLWETFTTFNWRGDGGSHYGYQGPMLDLLSAPLFVLGLGYSTYRWRRWRFFLPAFWFWATAILGGVLTVDAPTYTRLVGLMPIVYLFAALVIDRLWHLFSVAFPGQRQRLFLIPLFLWLAGVAFLNYQGYFHTYVSRDRPRSWVTELALYIRELGPEYEIYFFMPPILYFDYATIRFLAPDAQGVSVVRLADQVPIRKASPKGAAFIFGLHRLDELSQVQSWYPKGKLEEHVASAGSARFVSYLVSTPELERVRSSLTVP